MRFALFLTLFACTTFAFADTIPGLNSTGNGTPGSADASWTVNGGTAFVTGNTTFPFPYWFADTATSKWISPKASYAGSGSDARDTNYDFQTTFTLPSNFLSASITFQAATDNGLTGVSLNGASVGFGTTMVALPGDAFLMAVIPEGTGFGSGLGSPLTILSGFHAGLNTLDFFVQNSSTGDANVGNPTGLNVALTGDFTASATPEPSTFVLLGTGLLAGGAFLRRRRRLAE